MKFCVKGIFKGYRYFISPMLPRSCRYFPSCSEYGIEAVEKKGVVKGLYLTFKRIIRCHPFAKGGYDPVE